MWKSRCTIINSFWAIPISLLIVIISKFKLIKIGPIRSKRIGHFVGEGAEQIAYHKVGKKNTIDLYYFQDYPTCNKFWESKLKEKLPIYNHRIRYVDIWLQYFYGSKFHRPSSTLGNRDTKGLFLNNKVKIEFRQEENIAGKKWLDQKGIGSTPYVCLIVRDNAYLKLDSLHKRELTTNPEAYTYHSYRDTRIGDYKTGIEWLLNQGVGVLRMGKMMNEKITINHPKFIDYAFDVSRSDFLDYWLFANCTGTISTSTGPDHISLLHNKPILFLNALPLSLFYSFANCIWVPKNLMWGGKEIDLNLKEYLENGYLHLDDYVKNDIKIFDLSKLEILVAIKEFYFHKIRKQEYSLAENNLQESLKKQFVTWDSAKKYHDYINPESRIGKDWVESKLPQFMGNKIETEL